MSAEIRHYNPSTDADAVSEFFNRNQYGPARDSVALTGAQLNLVLAERGMRLFLVAEDRGRIVGTIGYLQVSGRRVSRDDELFAGMFVIDPAYRSGFLAGRLFTSSFGHLLDEGIESLRVEVNPANTKAFPLYVRVGFRSAEPHPHPDQDGYIELVSHLPGVVSRLLRELASDVPLTDVFASFSWRTMAGGRNRTISHGVTSGDDGEVVVEYEFTVRGQSIRVTVRIEDGSHIETTIDGEVVASPASSTPAPVGEPAAPRRPPVHRQVTVGDYTIAVDAAGTVSVRHPSYLGDVYRDALATVPGSPTAWRRPASRQPVITEHRGGWMLAWQIDGARLQKQISIEGETLSMVVSSESGRGIVAEPWSSVRTGVIRSRLGGLEQFQTPNVPGLCPRDVVDFEASHAPQPHIPHRRIVVEEPVSGVALEFEWQTAELLRMEGQLLGRATTTGRELRYSLTLGRAAQSAAGVADAGPPTVALPDGIEWVAEPAMPESGRAGADRATPSRSPQNWVSETRGGHPASVARGGADSELVVVAERGIASWRVDRADVLASPFPSSRTLGPLDDWNAGLWVSRQGDRDDAEHGVGWGVAPHVDYGTEPAAARASWSVDVLDDAVSSLRLTVRGERVNADDEIVAHLTPKVSGPVVFIAAHPVGWWQLNRTGPRWYGFARAARIPLADGRVLSIAPDEPGDELLIRSNANFFLVSLISRADPSGSVWTLAVESSEDSP
jgi:ribosomal protein S18 acetylase RimI-like enzyme